MTLTKIPKNEISALQSEQVDKILDEYETDFENIGIKINLHRLPVIVGEISPNRLGECHFDENDNGRAIVLSRNLFLPEIENEVTMSKLETVLLHEIGHCYFKRDHTKENVDFHGKMFFYPKETFVSGFGHYRLVLSSNSIPVSIMRPSTLEIPKTFRKYYVSEIAGKALIKKVEDLPGFKDFIEIIDGAFSLKTIEAPITGGEVKILYPCGIADSLPLEKEEHEKIVFMEREKGPLFESGIIYRLQTTDDGDDITIKYRSSGPIRISETGYNYLRKTDGELKCEMDVTYDPNSPTFVSTCGYKTDGLVLKQTHEDFLSALLFPPHMIRGNFNRFEVQATKWKLKVGSLAKKASIEVWEFRDECILEASAKFEGMENALSTLKALKDAIPSQPSPVQGNKTGRVLEVNTFYTGLAIQ